LESDNVAYPNTEINVYDRFGNQVYGPVNDVGLADNWCIAQLTPALGGKLFHKAGTYPLDTRIMAPANTYGVGIVGESMGTPSLPGGTYFEAVAGFAGDMIELNEHYDYVQDIGIYGLAGVDLINLGSVDTWVFRCLLAHYRYGVDMSGNQWVDQCIIGQGLANGVGIRALGGTNSITRNLFNAPNDGNQCIQARDGRVKIIDNDFESTDFGVVVPAGLTVDSIIASLNNFYNMDIYPYRIEGTLTHLNLSHEFVRGGGVTNNYLRTEAAAVITKGYISDITIENLAAAVFSLAGTQNLELTRIEGYTPVGSIGPPAVPLTTVAYTNAYGFPCLVTITETTPGDVTVVGIDGVNTNLTPPCSVVVAHDETIAFVYTVAPTWVWYGL